VTREGAQRWEGEITQLDARAVVRGVSRAPIDLPEASDDALHVQFWPHRHGTDGMFIALFERNA
jgi:16S rRNA (cytosine967-C5)-methyltransferase